ncbi:hypothetical protein Tco_0544056 [Tanacetum coccineum]
MKKLLDCKNILMKRQRVAKDAEIAKQLQEEFDRARQEQEVVVEVDQAHDIDWSDLANHGGYKQSHFKGMRYEDIRPIFEREIYSEDIRKYWKIIRVGGHIEAYQNFDDMLKKFDKDDLDKLWNLVKERFRIIEPTEDKARELLVKLYKKILTSGPRYSLDAK